MKKLVRCCSCHKSKRVGDFHKNRACKSGHTPACKVCCIKRVRKYYKIHAEKMRLHGREKWSMRKNTHNKIRNYNNKQSKLKNIDILLLRYMPLGKWICTCCNHEFQFCQMALHHPDSVKKTCNISRIITNRDISDHFKEFDKCQWLCLRCHNNKLSNPYLSYYETNRIIGKRKDRNIALLLQTGIISRCSKCGDDLKPKEWCWHHKNPKHKSNDVGKLLPYSFKRVVAEVKKCELCCANCHAIAENERRLAKAKTAQYDNVLGTLRMAETKGPPLGDKEVK